MRIRRVPCSMTARTQTLLPLGRSAVKKSSARIPCAWDRRNSAPTGAVAARCRADASVLEDLPDRGRCHRDAESRELAVDPAVSPRLFLPGQPQHRRPHLAMRRRAPGAAPARPARPAAADDVPVPAHDRARSDNQPHRRQALRWHRRRKQRQPRPVRPCQTRMSTRPLALGHSELMAQHQDLGVLPPRFPPRQPQQRHGTGSNQEDQLQPHKPKTVPRRGRQRAPSSQRSAEHPASWHTFRHPHVTRPTETWVWQPDVTRHARSAILDGCVRSLCRVAAARSRSQAARAAGSQWTGTGTVWYSTSATRLFRGSSRTDPMASWIRSPGGSCSRTFGQGLTARPRLPLPPPNSTGPYSRPPRASRSDSRGESRDTRLRRRYRRTAPPRRFSFSWRIALLCVPYDTSVIPGSAILDVNVQRIQQVAAPQEACQTPSARSEVVVTGKYPSPAPASAPTADIGQDTSGIVRFGIPAAEQQLIVRQGDDYRVSVPHVLSSSDLCPSSTHEPQPTGSRLTDVDGGPQPTGPECKDAVSSGIRSFRVVKVLDESLHVLSADTVQMPAATDETFFPRPGFRWNDESGSAVVAVQLNSPEQDAISHKDEIYGAICLAIAAAAFIALFQEIKDRLKPEDQAPC